MKKTLLRRLEVLEEQERARQQAEKSSIRLALLQIWEVVLAYYVGGIEPEQDDCLTDAYARALKFESSADYFGELDKASRTRKTDLFDRGRQACCQLFALKGNFEHAPPNELFHAFVQFVDELPDKWLRKIRSDIDQFCKLEFPVGSNIPRAITCENFLVFM